MQALTYKLGRTVTSWYKEESGLGMLGLHLEGLETVEVVWIEVCVSFLNTVVRTTALG